MPIWRDTTPEAVCGSDVVCRPSTVDEVSVAYEWDADV
jgi:hypothetical protein